MRAVIRDHPIHLLARATREQVLEQIEQMPADVAAQKFVADVRTGRVRQRTPWMAPQMSAAESTSVPSTSKR